MAILNATPPQGALYGILSPAVTVITEQSEDWINGFQYETTDAQAKVEISTIVGANPPVDYVAIEPVPGAPTVRNYYPFMVTASVRASTMGTKIDQVQAAAENALEIVMQKAIEIEFWKGTAAQALTAENDNRYLSHVEATDVTPTPGTAIKVKYGQALLEQALGNGTIGSRGTLHAPLLIASAMAAGDRDGALTTGLGNTVVAGAGYSNTGPDGEVAPTGTAWMYATGPVTVHLGPMPTITPEKMSQAVNVSKNEIEFFVDRPAAVTWSTTPLYAVLVNLELDY